MPARSKSFTGCWTCRARKIKCDLGQPECRQCQRAKIKCGGYSVRLCWAEKDKAEFRRTLGFVRFPPEMMYETYDELDELLTRLNAQRPGDETVTMGPFAVFRGSPLPSPASENGSLEFQLGSGLSSLELPSVHSVSSLQSSTSPQQPVPFSAHDASELFPVDLQPSRYQQLDSLQELQGLVDGQEMLGFNESDLLSYQVVPPEFAILRDQDLENLLFEPVPSQTLQFLPPNEVQELTMTGSPRLTAQSQQLLWHYHERLVPNMSVVMHNKNPWRSIYTPRALAAIGDIISMGHTSYARYAILHAITAASAFHLALRFPAESSGNRYFRELGDRLHITAKGWLSRCLKGHNIGKYKDYLVALLSMWITEYVRGDQGSLNDGAGSVLGAAQRLIRLRLIKRPKVSSKATVLHRSCAVAVLLIRAARGTAITDSDDEYNDDAWMDVVFADVSTKPPPARLAALQKMSSRQSTSLRYLESQADLEKYFQQYNDDAQDSAEANSLQLIYGIPDSLAYLLKEACKVSWAALRQRERGTSTWSMIKRCTSFEASLSQWRHNYRSINDKDDRNAIIEHHTLSFYEALVVYHYRIARDVNPELLQPAVGRVIEHLEAIRALNLRRERPLLIPLLFQGFVCACEASPRDKSLQARYDQWFHDLHTYGLSSYESASRVISEVHRRRHHHLPGGDWWTVVTEWGVDLNLY